jgi:hypothetical protein
MERRAVIGEEQGRGLREKYVSRPIQIFWGGQADAGIGEKVV